MIRRYFNKMFNYLHDAWLDKNIGRLLVMSVVIHIIMMLAVRDIYFSSPIDKGMSPTKSTNEPITKRVVLFVADGLRSDIAFESSANELPNLSILREKFGAWGISHTRVPTESRPGHVAMLAGIYEDPSAIFEGWQANPVPFDSVINQSTQAYCWGSPDIVNLFNFDNSPHIHQNTYDTSMQDFGKRNTSILDLWVFEKVETFLRQYEFCHTCQIKNNNGQLFFLHLLGMDTVGHGFKPFSKEYNENLKILDNYIPIIQSVFDKVFTDKKTTFIFTSDHGMTNWGSHGAGLDVETSTPFIIWGAGIRPNKNPMHINQVDIAPLISVLLGNNYPVNSLGRLPYFFLNGDEDNITSYLISNLEQIFKILQVKYERTKKTAFIFKPFRNLDLKDYHNKIQALLPILHTAGFVEMLRAYENSYNLMLEGIDYYQYYYKDLIYCFVTIGFVLWVIYLCIYTAYEEKKTYHRLSETVDLYKLTRNNYESFDIGNIKATTIINILVLMSLFLKIYTLPLPGTYGIYVIFPIIMLQIIGKRYKQVKKICEDILDRGLKRTILETCLYLAVIESLFLGFYYKIFFSIAVLFLPVITYLLDALPIGRPLMVCWIWSCTALSIFPLLPEMISDFNYYAFCAGAIIFYTISDTVVNKFHNDNYPTRPLNFQLYTFIISAVYSLFVRLHWLDADSILKYIAIPLAILPILVTFTTTNVIVHRLQGIMFGFASYYVMLTIHYEMIFLICYMIALALWLRIESRTFPVSFLHRLEYSAGEVCRGRLFEDFRFGLFFLTFIFIGFFGTGNIASLNSFDPMWVECFITVFQPFKMGVLIVFKIMIPFLYASNCLSIIHQLYRGPVLRRFCITLLFSDILLLHFFYCVTNTGSWLEIGMSLSHFLIMEFFILIILLINMVAHFFAQF